MQVFLSIVLPSYFDCNSYNAKYCKYCH